MPAIAIFGAFIAYRQLITGRNKLKLDLFEKRFKIFEATRIVLSEAMKHHKPKDEDLYPFLIATIDAKWLFNQDIADYLRKDLWSLLTDFQELTEELENPDPQADRMKIIHQRSALRKRLSEQFDQLEQKLSPFLQLSH